MNTDATTYPKLTFTSATPSYVRRAYRVILKEFGVDVRKMPQEHWTPILIAACDNDGRDTFRDAVMTAMRKVLEEQYWWTKWK